MKEQTDLFGNDTAAASAAAATPTGTALRLGSKDARLSPAQKRFNQLVERIDKLKGQIADVQALADVHRRCFTPP
ncbi:MAG: hypothetical protein H0W47_04455 [Polaromonas sp.]|uniref:hypothetical protein n=1 Tax=Polaromonas sp. TaxID=1869339 RepID=UPI00185A6FCF|nr:hypothetical protein [Polaromonas sp.]MBA3593035.1 hypothetical protein [Polaromonas sp.]